MDSGWTPAAAGGTPAGWVYSRSAAGRAHLERLRAEVRAHVAPSDYPAPDSRLTPPTETVQPVAEPAPEPAPAPVTRPRFADIEITHPVGKDAAAGQDPEPIDTTDYSQEEQP